MKSTIHQFLNDRRGNFGILSSLLLPVLLGAAGLAVDVSSMMLAKQDAQNYADGAALAASSALADDDIGESAAKLLAGDFLKAQGTALAGTTPTIMVQTTPGANNSKTFTVDVSFNQTISLSPLMSIFGKKTATIAINSRSVSNRGASNSLSMFLVLDRSGSMQTSTTTVKSTTVACHYYYMPNTSTVKDGGSKTPCYYQRIEGLKLAADTLFATFASVDPNLNLIRTGAVSYNSGKQTESQLAWGWSAADNYIDALTPTGGTSSTGAFKVALDALTATTEDAAHKNKNGLAPKKAIVFMTDGENSASSDDTSTLTHCATAKSKGITVYTVAFSASDQGKNLLSKCATSSATFFYADSASELTAAFKSIGQVAATGLPRLTQ
jgi:Flp pilus assembly protein TadG